MDNENKNLYALDIEDFLHPKWGHVGRFGGGALGIITKNQMVNVINMFNGAGDHDDTKEIILKELYGEDDACHLKDIVLIKYSNSYYKPNNTYIKNFFVYIPDVLNIYQFETLCCLSCEFDELLSTGIHVYVSGNGLNDIKNGQNELKSVIAELGKRISDRGVVVVENMATFDETGKFLVNDAFRKIKRG